jgi:hypothetical protein
VGWQAAVRLTLLTEDAVEWVLAWLRWGSYGKLDIHKLCPCRVRVNTELLDTFLDTEIDIIDRVVERWNYNKNSDDRKCGTRRSDTNDQLGFRHCRRLNLKRKK